MPVTAVRLPPRDLQPTGWRGRVQRVLHRVTAPAPVQRLAAMPLTVAGLGVVAWGIATVTVTGAIIFAGLAAIALEYLIADED